MIIGLIFLLTGCGSSIAADGIVIPQSQVDMMVQAQESLQKAADADSLRQNVINQIVDQTLLKNEAVNEGVKVSDESLKQRQKAVQDLWNQGGAARLSLEAQGYTYENLKDKVKDQMLIEGLTDSLGKPTDDQKIKIERVQDLLEKLKAQKK